MGFKEALQRLGEKRREKKAMFKQAEDRLRIQRILEDRQKSANERELERFHKEDREEAIKSELDLHRIRRDKDIKFNHNPLHTKNIMKSEWEILKEKNQFANSGNMFSNTPFIHKNNRNLLNSGRYGI